MNKILTALILISLLGVISACKKKSNVIIQAQDYITGEGSAYANMHFSVYESRTGTFENKSKLTYEGNLDANGHASFDLKMYPNRKYILNVSNPDNICYGGVFQYYLDHEKVNNVTFDFAHCSYSKLIINNMNCFDSNDKLVLFQDDDLGVISSGIGWEHNGCVYWETSGGTDGDPIGYSSLPSGNIYYKWVVTRNSQTNTYFDTVYYPAGELITYQIDY